MTPKHIYIVLDPSKTTLPNVARQYRSTYTKYVHHTCHVAPLDRIHSYPSNQITLITFWSITHDLEHPWRSYFGKRLLIAYQTTTKTRFLYCHAAKRWWLQCKTRNIHTEWLNLVINQLDQKKKIAATRDRTRDLQIFSLTLSQLSYHGYACDCNDCNV